MVAGNAAGKQNSGSGHFAAYIPYNSIYFFNATFVCGQNNRPGEKKWCNVLDETLGLYEINVQVTQTFTNKFSKNNATRNNSNKNKNKNKNKKKIVIISNDKNNDNKNDNDNDNENENDNDNGNDNNNDNENDNDNNWFE